MLFRSVFLIALSVVSNSAAALTAEPLTRFGQIPSRGNGELYLPSGVAVDQSTGNVYVGDSLNQQVQVFTADGLFLRRWGFGGAVGLTVDPVDSSVYVGSVSTNRLHKFDSLGNQLAVWGSTGSGPGEFRQPRDVAVHPVTRNVFVLDSENKRVQEFTPTGELVQVWPSDPALFRPYGIAIDPTGSAVWIANTGGYNIRKYDLSGNLLLAFGSTGSAPGFFRWPRNIAVDASGNVFIADTDMERVQKFDSEGNWLQVFQGPENDVQGPAHPRAIDVNLTTGEIYTAAAYANRIDRFDATGNYLHSWGHHDRDGFFLSTPMGLAVDPHNNMLYVADTNSHLIKKFSYDGVFLGQYGNWPFVYRDETAVSFPASLATDAVGNYWALNEGIIYPDDPTWGSDRYVRQFDSNGTYLSGFAHADFTGGMGDIVVNRTANELYVANTRKHKVMRFDFNGNLLGQWGSQGNGPGQFRDPAGIAIDIEANTLLVADVGNQRIQRFTLDGTFVTTYGGPGSSAGEFALRHYAGIAFDDRGNFYVADTGNNRVQVFDSDGNFLTAIGSYGTAPGQFRSPVAVDYDDGLLFVLEAGQREVEVFSIVHDPEWLDTPWVDDGVPAGAIQGGTWSWVATDPAPYSGAFARLSVSNGLDQHFFYNSPEPLIVNTGDALFAYVYLDPANPPDEIMLQWYVGGSWEHRAYWGANLIGFGVDGTGSRYYMGELPASGGWVRLEVPANLVGLEGSTVTGIAFTLYGGQAAWDVAGKTAEVSAPPPPPPPPIATDTPWVDDALPAGAIQRGYWNFENTNPEPFSGTLAHQSELTNGFNQHFFYNASERLAIGVGDTLFTYVYLDPTNPPSQLMLQWYGDGSWDHRAYWGANLVNYGADGTASRQNMGALPTAGGWVRLEIPASAVGLEGITVSGMAFGAYGGRVTWDYAGRN